MTEPNEPKLGILRAELMDESLKTYRLQQGNESPEFVVHVWFTRQVNVLERAQLAKHGYEVDFPIENDTMRGLLIVTAKTFSDVIQGLHDELPAIESDAERDWAEALAEDEHLGALVQQINLRINPR